MAEAVGNSAQVLVDSLQLAYDAFQACRGGGARPEAITALNLLKATMKRVSEQGELMVRMSDLGFQSVSTCVQVAAEREPLVGRCPVSGLSPQSRRLVAYMEVAADELHRLCEADLTVAVRSVGYALHCIPGLIRSERTFQPKSYEFCLRIVAYRWFELSERFRAAIGDLMDVDQTEIDRRAGEHGFAIDMFGYSRRGPSRAD